LKEWKNLGIELHQDSGIMDDYAEFFTFDEDVAKRLGFSKYEEEY
jgi:hypothetical protein